MARRPAGIPQSTLAGGWHVAWRNCLGTSMTPRSILSLGVIAISVIPRPAAAAISGALVFAFGSNCGPYSRASRAADDGTTAAASF